MCLRCNNEFCGSNDCGHCQNGLDIENCESYLKYNSILGINDMLVEVGAKSVSSNGLASGEDGGKGGPKSEHDEFIVAKERIKLLEMRLEHEESCYKDIFEFWNERYPDEMQEYLDIKE